MPKEKRAWVKFLLPDKSLLAPLRKQINKQKKYQSRIPSSNSKKKKISELFQDLGICCLFQLQCQESKSKVNEQMQKL